jgi:hypothetical protein
MLPLLSRFGKPEKRRCDALWGAGMRGDPPAVIASQRVAMTLWKMRFIFKYQIRVAFSRRQTPEVCVSLSPKK